ncbi:MAG: hypothetical protein D6732_25020, partial [Methanobacteriota archaeon]
MFDYYHNLVEGYETASTDPIYVGISDRGFNFIDSENSSSEAIAHSIYRIYSDDETTSDFYYDTRDCNPSGSPDVYFVYDYLEITPQIRYYFSNWPGGEENSYPIEPGDTIRLHWSTLDPEVVLENNPIDLPNPTNYDCYKAKIALLNRLDETDVLSGQFFLPGKNIYVNSGDTVNLWKGYSTAFISDTNITYNGQYGKHHNWMDNNLTKSLRYSQEITGDQTLRSKYLEPVQSSLSTQTNNDIPISIQDPWWVDPVTGEQLNTFHEFTGETYEVFKKEGDIEDTTSWQYAVSVPSADTVINGHHYVFDTWLVSGAALGAYPGEESNPL